VLARILADRRIAGTREGVLAMTAAVVIDAIVWPLLAIAIALTTGVGGQATVALVGLGAGVAVAVVAHRLLSTERVRRWCDRFPLAATGAVAVAALLAAAATDHGGLTPALGAVLVGLASPRVDPGAAFERGVTFTVDVGRRLIPVFFVVTGMNVTTGGFSAWGWATVAVALALALAGKIGGGYLGARLGGESRLIAVRTAILLDTRGLTEIVVLQAGFQAGILTHPMMLALVVMALTTTALTSPLLTLVDRLVRRASAPAPPPVQRLVQP
jgi:Kef-type K+ transport system membrane component KefB